MAHNLYKNVMAYTGEVPWHGLGVQFEEEFTAAQALEAALLGYHVSKEPIFRCLPDGTYEKVESRFVTVNNDTQAVLGFVGNRYEVLQNSDAFAFADILMSETGGRFQTAMALGEGEKVALLMKLPTDFAPLLGDKIEEYCLFSNSHDGTSEVDVRFTPIRVVCQNTLNAALKGSKSTISLRHTSSVKARLEQSAMILCEMRNHFNALGQTFTQFAELQINDEFIAEYEALLFGPVPEENAHGVQKTIRRKKVEMFETHLYQGMGVDLPGVSGTGWWLYNAATEMADYSMGKDEKRVQSILFGKGADFKQLAFDSMLALVNR